MRLSIKEKAGIPDTHAIFEGLHLRKQFIENMADIKKKGTLDPDCVEEGQKHFRICKKCLQELTRHASEPKEQDLSL